MPNRRNFLRWSVAAAAAAASVPLIELATQTTASAATRMPITIVNNTGAYANSAIWLYIVGSDVTTGAQAYVRADGTLVPVSPSLNGSDGFADLSIPLAASGGTTVSLPNMSGRIYFSINQKLKFKVVTDGAGHSALQYPAGWVSSDPSYPVLHDWIEFTFNNSGMFCNTTMVDMFSVPLAIALSGAAQQTTGTLKPGGRAAIFAGIKAQPDFARLVVGDSLRVLAPGHGIDAGLFSATYYDQYVNSVWSAYANTDLDVVINSTTYTGRTSGNSLVFNNGGGTFGKPTTSDVFYCAGALAPPAGNAGPVAAILGAALNRSTLLNAHQPITDPAQFYQQATTNHYSQVIHQNTVDGKAYGFPFDDVSNFASYVQDGSPNSMTVTLTPFNDAGGGNSAPGLLSAGKPATASSLENATFPASNATDGNASTRWSSAFADPQWIYVDLGAAHSVNRVVLNWEAAYGKAYQIQTSTNASTWTTVYSTSTGDGGTDDVSFTAANARYVRVNGTTRGTPYGYSLFEFQVYGT